MDLRTPWTVFQELGCCLGGLRPDDVNWMAEGSMKHFMTWFQEHITSDNVLNYGELEEYERMCSTEPQDEELDEALANAGVPMDLLPISSFDINEEKDEINFLREQSNVLSKVEEQLLISLKKQEETEILLKKEYLEKQKATFKDGQALMKMSVLVKSSLTNFHQSLQQLSSICLKYRDNNQHHFLAQAPLEDLLAQCDIFKQNMKLFINRQFDQKEQHVISDYFAEKEHSLTMFNVDEAHGLFKVHPQRLWAANVSKVCARAKFKGITAALENMQLTGKALLDHGTISNIWLYSARLQDECAALRSEIDILRQHEVSTTTQNFVVFKIAAIAEEVARQRCIRRRYRLEKLQSLQDKILRHVLLTDVLWMFLRREKKLVKLAGQFLDEAVTFLHQEHAKHLSVMELHKLIEQRYATFLKALANGDIRLVDIMCRLLNVKNTSNVETLVEAIHELMKRMEDVNQHSFMGGRLDPDLGMEKSLKMLQAALVAGPTKQVSIIPTDILQKIRGADNTLEELEGKLDELERNFSSKQVYFSKYPVQRDSRLLWAWFLTDPSKLHTALKYAERMSQNQGNQADHGSLARRREIYN